MKKYGRLNTTVDGNNGTKKPTKITTQKNVSLFHRYHRLKNHTGYQDENTCKHGRDTGRNIWRAKKYRKAGNSKKMLTGKER